MDDMTFFHQATMKICGSLDENRMIRECHLFLKEFLPLTSMMLCTYEGDKGAMHILSLTDNLPEEAKTQPLFLSSRSREFLDTEAATSRVCQYGNQKNNPVSLEMKHFLGLSRYSEIVLSLKLDDERLGAVLMFSDGSNEFNAEHARLASLLHDPFAVALANLLKHRELTRLKDLLADDNQYLRRELHHLSGDEIVGARFGLRDVMEMVWQVAPMDVNVILTGETGVGKEVFANAVHYASARRNGPFIKVNCGAFTENLLDSELFGHEKGAFTGAMQSKRGRFERAHKGTLFLDEVGELTPSAQVRLLRVLQDGSFERVGGSRPVLVDVRIIAATHRNLPQMVKNGQFRQDLWFRLNVFPIHIPALRERTSDIPELVHHFINRKLKAFNLSGHPVVAPGTMEQLTAYEWPGNVRELENMVERALIRHQGQDGTQPLQFPDLAGEHQEAGLFLRPDSMEAGGHQTLDDAIKQHICSVMKATNGKIQGKAGAAAILNIHPSTLRSRMDKLGISYGRGEK
jgi:transcriptional regulator with GAF, ATPase, and Fis domain